MGSISIPDYGKRLLPVEIDRLAREDPDRVLFYTPRNNEPSQGYEVVTTRKFANAINRVCWWLESEIESETPTTIGYLGQNDIRYFLLILAATKIGHRVLLSSPRNSIEGHRSLIEQSHCKIFITSSGVGKTDFLQDLEVSCFQVPDLFELLDPSEVKPYVYKKSWEQGKPDVLALLHTSGSTGLPRLIPHTLQMIASLDALYTVEPVQGKMPTIWEWANTKMLCAMPLFHVAGINFGLSFAIYFGWKVVFPPTGPVMQHIIEETLDNIDVDSAFVSPSVLADIAKTPRILDKLAKLDFVTSAGGPIPPSAGNIIHSRVSIFPTMGMTEGLLVPSVATHPDEWAYFHFHPCCGYVMQPYSSAEDRSEDEPEQNNNLFELVFVKDSQLAATQAVFMTFPHLDEYHTKDLYSRHPTIPDLYKYETRLDDLIVLSNGEKLNPLAAEMQLVAATPWITAAHISGRGHFQVAVLLQPTEYRRDESDRTILRAVWPSIETVNQTLPAFAQIHRNFVRIVRKSFPRTPKGTVARHEIERLFSQEIADIYTENENADSVDTPPSSADTPVSDSLLQINDAARASEETVRDVLRDAVQTVSPGLELERISDDDNLFRNGFDSLHVIRLSKLLSSAFPSSTIQVDAGTIYTHPSIAKLGHALWTQLQLQQREENSNNEQEANRAERERTANDVSSMLAKYLPSLSSALSRQTAKHSVVLTGSTGAIGSYLLDVLCKNDRIAKIWCFNRSNMADAVRRQADLAQSKGLSLDWKGKVRFVQTDLASEALGLSQADLKEVRDQATIIIHNAWEVNFNLPLSSFETQFIGLESLIRICAESHHTISFFFVSSISSALNWPSHLFGPIPEAKITNLDAPVNGYGASKLVAEHLLSKAAQAGVLHLSVLRVGQVAGPVITPGDGSIWTRRDWLPAIIDASAFLRKLPADLGSASTLDWIPIDLLAEIIGQLVDSGTKEATGKYSQQHEIYYNLVNPQTSSWAQLLPTIQARLQKIDRAPEKVQIVPFSQWIDALQDAEAAIVQEAETSNDMAQTPSQTTASGARTGLKLLSFFRMLAAADNSVPTATNWAVNNGLARSLIFAQLPPVSPGWFETWLNQWGY